MQPDFFEQKPQNKEQAHPAIERARARATKILQENAITLDEFEGFYDQQKLERDREKIHRKEVGFDTMDANKQCADVLEAIIFDQAGAGLWFGENTRAIKTSAYDDYFNGSDIILELEDTARTLAHLSLSIDITFGTSTEDEKISKIKDNIDKGTLGSINYFKSSRSRIRGEVSQVPQVIIGVEKDTVIKLANLWMDKNEHAEFATVLRDHPIKRLILSEILLQLHTFKNYIVSTGKPELAGLVPIYEKDIQILEDVIREQGPIDMTDLRNDKVFMAIRQSLRIFKTAK